MIKMHSAEPESRPPRGFMTVKKSRDVISCKQIFGGEIRLRSNVTLGSFGGSVSGVVRDAL